MNKDDQLNRIEQKLDQLLELINNNSIQTNPIKKKVIKEVVETVDKYSEDIKTIFATYKVKINKRSRLIKKAEQKIKARLKEYKFDQIILAITNFSADDWWMKNNAQRGIAWFFHSEDRIEQFIHLIPQKENIKLELIHNGQPCKIIDRRLKVYAPWSGNWLDWNKNHPQFETFVLKGNGKEIKKGRDAYKQFLKENEL